MRASNYAGSASSSNLQAKMLWLGPGYSTVWESNLRYKSQRQHAAGSGKGSHGSSWCLHPPGCVILWSVLELVT